MNLNHLVNDYLEYLRVEEEYTKKCIETLDNEINVCESSSYFVYLLSKKRLHESDLKHLQKATRDKTKLKDYISRICNYIRRLLFIGETIELPDFRLLICKTIRRGQYMKQTDYAATKRLREEGKLEPNQFAYHTSTYHYYLKGEFLKATPGYYITSGRGTSSIVTEIYRNESNKHRYQLVK